jgi:hypothetical protein
MTLATDEQSELLDRIAAMTAERDAWKMLAEGRTGLLTAYRIGGRPPEGALRKIEKAKAALEKLGVDDA